MNYPNFKIEELLKDKTFHNWVFQSNPVDMDFWNSYLSANPDQMDLIKVASRIIKGIPVFEEKVSMGYVHLNWLELDNRINYKEGLRFSQRNNGLIGFSVAAGILTLVFITIFCFFIIKTPGVYSTSQGEKKNLVLPDQTRVTLNPNSLFVYSNYKEESKSGEVFLEGNALFSVHHKFKNQTYKFGRAFSLKIEDVGTEFNISNKENLTDIIVNSGKLRINIEETSKSFLMVSGDNIVFEKQKDRRVKKKSNSKINTV